MTAEPLRLLVAEMLEVPESQVTADTSRATAETWDSLNHLQLITVIEEKFGLKFKMDEIAGIQTVGELERVVAERATRSPHV